MLGCSKSTRTCSLNSLSSSVYSFSAQRRFFSQSLLTLRQHYDALEVSPDADRSLIKAQFYKLSKNYHPDANPNDETAHSKFLRINEAYSVLKNEQSRREYDRSIQHKPNNNSNSYYSYRPRARRRGNNAGVYSGTTGRDRSGFNLHNKQQTKFNFQEHFQRHYGEELRRAKSEVHKEKEKIKMDSLNYKQGQRMFRLGLLVSMTIILGAGGHIFA
jgi:curved DNA-binding protein CbpA